MQSTTQSANRRFGQRPAAGQGSNSGSANSYSRSSRPGGYSQRPAVRPNRNTRGRAESIDVSRFINKAINSAPSKPVEIINQFSDFNICAELKTNLKKRNYTTPTPIQDQSINHIIDGRDLIGLANTGTGKTGAFLLPLIDKIYKDKTQKVLIVAPTRELAIQIENEFRLFSWGMKIFSALCVGGLPIYRQMGHLRREHNFVIGTPGRLKDLSERGALKFATFNNIVLDEVDRMLDMGFVDEIKLMLSQLPETRQTLFFSATMPLKIRNLTSEFLKNPISIEVKTGDTATNVEQDVVRVPDKAFKFDRLQELLNQPELSKVLIFSETKMEVERLTTGLLTGGFKAESIHGDKRQGQRQRALRMFKENEINILVATDVAARGLDIKDITHVINYTIPQTYDDYVHRIGRTGRANSKGIALTFV